MKVLDCKSTVHAAMNFNDTGFTFLIRGLVGSLERLEVPNASVCATELVQLCIKMIFLFQFPSLRSPLTPSSSRRQARLLPERYPSTISPNTAQRWHVCSKSPPNPSSFYSSPPLCVWQVSIMSLNHLQTQASFRKSTYHLHWQLKRL